jgi:protein gp37
MGDNTKIQWATHTGNLWWGCQEVHAGCDHCYAREWDKQYGGNHWGAKASRKVVKSVWTNFKRWQRLAEEAGRIDRVFVGSMMDIFEVSHPCVDHKGNALDITTGELRQRFFKEVVPACPNLLFLLLTKRPSNIPGMVPASWLHKPPKNVMYGVSVVDQETADREIPKLLAVPGQRFLSIEPLLGHVCLGLDGITPKHLVGHSYIPVGDMLHWVIVGGESGYKARPFNPVWARSIVEQCQSTGVPVFVKQMGGNPQTGSKMESRYWDARWNEDSDLWRIILKDKKGGDMSEWPDDLRIRQLPEHYTPKELVIC